MNLIEQLMNESRNLNKPQKKTKKRRVNESVSINDIVKGIRVNMPAHADAPAPKYDPLKINESEFDEEYRCKSCDIQVSDNLITVNWVSEERPYGSDDYDFYQEILRAIKANLDAAGYTQPIDVEINLSCRESGNRDGEYYETLNESKNKRRVNEAVEDTPYRVYQVTFDVAVPKGTKLSYGQGYGNREFAQAIEDACDSLGYVRAGDEIDAGTDLTDVYRANDFDEIWDMKGESVKVNEELVPRSESNYPNGERIIVRAESESLMSKLKKILFHIPTPIPQILDDDNDSVIIMYPSAEDYKNKIKSNKTLKAYFDSGKLKFD